MMSRRHHGRLSERYYNLRPTPPPMKKGGEQPKNSRAREKGQNPMRTVTVRDAAHERNRRRRRGGKVFVSAEEPRRQRQPTDERESNVMCVSEGGGGYVAIETTTEPAFMPPSGHCAEFTSRIRCAAESTRNLRGWGGDLRG
jgi:hypothetical protein